MKVSALLTSAGINTGICVLFLSLYSILRKQPSYRNVFFGRRLASLRSNHNNAFSFDRLVPSPSWILKAWETSEEEILSIGGLDAVVFCRILVFSMRIFSIAAIICIFLVLPLNYYGQEEHHKRIHSESLEVFSIGNVKEGSEWLWAHCVALYVISLSACTLLYFEYKSISQKRLSHVTRSPANPSHFTVLVRAIPWSSQESYSESVRKYFTKYHASSYLSHQMVYRSGTVQQLMNEAEKMCHKIREIDCKPNFLRCGHCGGISRSFKVLTSEVSVKEGSGFHEIGSAIVGKECATAFVFFKTRFAAFVASQILQSSNPMLWVTDLAPESHDIYWSNLWIPYRQLWIRRIATLLAAIVFVFVFMAPVTLVQGMLQLDELQNKFRLQGLFKTPFMKQLITGYLPSVILMLFLYTVPPIMMLFSALEGPISRSGRKKSACCKVLYFIIWNVFFLNCFFGSVIDILKQFERPREVLYKLSQAVPRQATFFITYVLTSGWASLSCEIMQPYLLLCNLFRKVTLRISDDSSDSTQSFPYHTEIPRVLLLGLLGFTCSIMSPLILPFVLIYFALAYLVYKNQFLNVYSAKYESGGQFWPIAYNTTIFSVVLTQVIAVGVFGLKEAPVASGFSILLVILTLLFHGYCRQRFYPIFKNTAAEVLIEMDQLDEQDGRLEQIYEQLPSAYNQFLLTSRDLHNTKKVNHHKDKHPIPDPQEMRPGKEPIEVTIECTLEREELDEKKLEPN